MNKYEQALWNIRVSKPANKLNAEIIALQELVERATPKKVLNKKYVNSISGRNHAECPNCAAHITDYLNKKYCDCSQKLDWSE